MKKISNKTLQWVGKTVGRLYICEVFSIKDKFSKVHFEYKYRKVILSLREYFDISLQKEKLTWDVMLYKD